VALMEAMAQGLPVVSTAISGIPELIEDGVSGLLVPEKDEVRLAEELKRLIRDKELRVSLGRGARKRVEDQFDLSANVEKLAALYWDADPKGKPSDRPILGPDRQHRLHGYVTPVVAP
jgi:glycosyltransferase involved in cell wall biosynthesis